MTASKAMVLPEPSLQEAGYVTSGVVIAFVIDKLLLYLRTAKTTEPKKIAAYIDAAETAAQIAEALRKDNVHLRSELNATMARLDHAREDLTDATRRITDLEHTIKLNFPVGEVKQ